MKLRFALMVSVLAAEALAGDMPEGYLPLEYLRGTGTQYIDTGYSLSSNSGVDIDFTLYAGYGEKYVFGSLCAEPAYHMLRVTYESDKWTAGCGRPWDKWHYLSSGRPSAVGSHFFSLNKNGYNVIDDYVKAFTPQEFTSDCSALIFAATNSTAGTVTSPVKMDLRAFDIYESGTLVRSFRPAFCLSDRTSGLFESVEQKFYSNVGTGAFEPSGGFVRIVGSPARYGAPSPAYGVVGGRAIGTEYTYEAPARTTTASKTRAVCSGWKFTRLDGTFLSGTGAQAKIIHSAADDGGTLEWLWTEKSSDYTSVNRTLIRPADGVLRTGETLAGFPLLVRVSPERISGFAYDQCADGGSNVWFSDSPDGLTALPMEVDNWDVSGESTFWVKMPALAADSVLYMFWGDEKPAASAESVWGDHVAVWHCTSVVDGGFADSTGRGNRLERSDTSAEIATSADAVIGQAKTTGAKQMILADYLGKVAAVNADRGTATVSGWFRYPSKVGVTQTYWLYPFMSYANNDGWYCETTARGNGNLTLRHGINRQISVKFPEYSTDWMHVAVVSENGYYVYNCGSTLYLNGVRATDDPVLIAHVLGTPEGMELKVGGEDIDEVRVRASASSADWIAAEYAQGANRNFLVCEPMQTFERQGLTLILR